ncbi:hypothetical protein [Synechococcus sp. CBW1107]|uniref:hypothetical protein n=1 Tax=Synechococcus sp. CBW1107 TaxID=2789857 RepID=UPI002AD53553|nr:hypothetical protein [Synechococcus sp. CBW1107]
MSQKKKIILLAYENDSKFLCSVQDQLTSIGHQVLIVESSISTATKLSPIKSRSFIGIASTLERFKNLLNSNIEMNTVYWELSKIEKSIMSTRKTFRQLLRTTPYLYDDHHTRKPYYNIPQDSVRAVFSLEIAKWFIDIIDSYEPDLVFCLQGNYFVKQFAASISQKKGYLFRALAVSRVREYMTLLDENFCPVFNAKPSIHSFDVARTILSEARINPPSLSYKGWFNLRQDQAKTTSNITIAFRELFSVFPRLFTSLQIRVISLLRRRISRSKVSIYWFNSSFLKTTLFQISSSLKAFIVYALYHRIFVSLSELNDLRKNGFRFVIYPLHVLPESNTLSFSENYYEMDHIRHISSRLPMDSFLLVKENIQMIGFRELSFYYQIMKQGNVFLIDPSISPSETFKLADSYIGISGTSLLEALAGGCEYVSAYGSPEFKELINSEYLGYCGVEKMISDFKLNRKPYSSSPLLVNYFANLVELNIKFDHDSLNHAFHGFCHDSDAIAEMKMSVADCICKCIDCPSVNTFTTYLRP